MAMAVIHVGMSPQAGGRCHGEPKMSIPSRNPAKRQPPQRVRTRQFLSQEKSACAPCAERYRSGRAAAEAVAGGVALPAAGSGAGDAGARLVGVTA